jgi:hypothetical protein
MSELQLEIQDIVIIVNAFQVAMNKGIYTKEEMDRFFPAWNNLTSMFEKQQRQQTFQNYKEKTVVTEEVIKEAKDDNTITVDVPK